MITVILRHAWPLGDGTFGVSLSHFGTADLDFFTPSKPQPLGDFGDLRLLRKLDVGVNKLRFDQYPVFAGLSLSRKELILNLRSRRSRRSSPNRRKAALSAACHTSREAAATSGRGARKFSCLESSPEVSFGLSGNCGSPACRVRCRPGNRAVGQRDVLNLAWIGAHRHQLHRLQCPQRACEPGPSVLCHARQRRRRASQLVSQRRRPRLRTWKDHGSGPIHAPQLSQC